MFVMACNRSALPLPKTTPNKGTSPTTVPYPPPPARAEIIPQKAGERVVWVDGSWNWDQRRWVWQKGRWEVPPKGAHYRLSKIMRLPDGSLGWLPGGWQTSNDQPDKSGAQNRNE
jgi:hypothetical protein